ncbi:MAG: lipoyl(octanoyl) transferase [Chloroflexi bacterium]|jgi:lipoyl(octanoyl) transferase|nr:MAG: lipoyl(octanoyl) transferase [Chloroflexota bacterium]
MRQTCTTINLGRIGYQEAREIQQAVAEARKSNQVGDTLLLVEHPHVFTLGRRGRPQDVLIDPDSLANLGIEVHETDRGGEVTYHGPGQVVAYPIMDIRRLGGPRRYVWGLEQTIIEVLSDYGIQGQRLAGMTGVWVDERKVASIGVRISRDVTTHGFALNVNTDLSFFDYIVPCGDPDGQATSIAEALGKVVAVKEASMAVASHFGNEFDCEMADTALSELLHAIRQPSQIKTS